MTEKTSSQLSRLINKIIEKFPETDTPAIMTDIHIRINQETGDAMAFDDNDEEITRIVVDEWISNTDELDAFYGAVANEIRRLLIMPTEDGKEKGHCLGLIAPYSFVLENENGDNIEELYLADDDHDTIIVGEPFMVGLSEELDDFINDLLK